MTNDDIEPRERAREEQDRRLQQLLIDRPTVAQCAILGWTPEQWAIAYRYFNRKHAPPKPFVFDLATTRVRDLDCVQRFWRDTVVKHDPPVKVVSLNSRRS